MDFEGHPGQAVSERRIKRLVLRDVAGMLCSFRYAAETGLLRQRALGRVAADEPDTLAPWADCWRLWVSVAFLKGYLDALGSNHRCCRRTKRCRRSWRYTCSTGCWQNLATTLLPGRRWSSQAARESCSCWNRTRGCERAAGEPGSHLARRQPLPVPGLGAGRQARRGHSGVTAATGKRGHAAAGGWLPSGGNRGRAAGGALPLPAGRAKRVARSGVTLPAGWSARRIGGSRAGLCLEG